MPPKKNQAREQKTREKKRIDAEQASPILTFCLFDKIDVRQTMFDSAGTFHKELMRSIGRVGLIPFNATLNGRALEFEHILKNSSNYLLLHSERDFEMSENEIKNLAELIKYVRQQKKCLQIFSTPIVAKKMNNRFHFTIIQDINEIKCKIRRAK